MISPGFHPIFLGGAPNANWLPLLGLLVLAIGVIKGGAMLFSFLKNKFRH
jgi:hypothetical protein